MTTSTITGPYVGLLAAGRAIVSKFARGREPLLPSIPNGFAPPGLEDMARLLHPRLDSGGDGSRALEQRIARITAASAFQALEAERDRDPYEVKPGGYAERLLSRANAERLRDRGRCAHEYARSLTLADSHDRGPTSASARSPLAVTNLCRYCAMFQELALTDDLPIEVVNHSARIQSDFDLGANISQAGIDDFQIFVPRDLARKALERSHPLRWKETAPDLFEETTAAVRDRSNGPSLRGWKRQAIDIDDWEEEAFRSDAYLYEQAKTPWNERVVARIENVLAIKGFGDISVPTLELVRAVRGERGRRGDATVTDGVRACLASKRTSGDLSLLIPEQGPERWGNNDARILSYDYSLESCIGSSYGDSWHENGGLDIDEGKFSGSAVHWQQIKPELVAHLTRSNLVHLSHAVARHGHEAEAKAKALAAIVQEGPNADVLPAEINANAVRCVAEALRALWRDDPWLVTISASKRLRYTRPRNGPSELWSILSWMAPAILFTFINRAVCQLPLFLHEGNGA